MNDKRTFSVISQRARGSHAELCVIHYLEKHGYTLIQRNFHTRYGEIDIIAQHGETIAFVEVKLRMTHYFDLDYLITPAKQRKIITSALIFLSGQSSNLTYRFDVALVTFDHDILNIEYIPNAFTEDLI